MNPLRRTLVGLVAASVVGVGLAVTGAAPAHATVGTVDTGSSISRTEIVERALSWTTEPVPYSQSAYYPASAPRTGTGHSYRQDCSGFLSMAWDLPTSAVTGDFVSSASPYDARLPSVAALQRGDLLGVQSASEQHVVLFLGWSADDAGRHRYFDMISEAHTGTDASVSTDQDLDGYWASYTPYADKDAVADVPRMASFGGTRVDEVSLDAAGHIVHSWRTSPTAALETEDLTAALRIPILRTAPAIASPSDGQLVILGTGQDGALIELSWSGSAWSARTLTSSGTVYGIDASGSAGRIDVVGRQLGSTTADGTGVLWHATIIGTTWSGWLRPVTPPPSIAGDPAVANGPGTADFVVESANGILQYGTWTAGTATWSWTTPFGAARVPTQPSVTRTTDGTVTVSAVIGGVQEQDILLPGAHIWTGWHQVIGPLTTTSLLVTRAAAGETRAAHISH